MRSRRLTGSSPSNTTRKTLNIALGYSIKLIEWCLTIDRDKNKAAGAEDRFKEIAEAYEVLSYKKKREVYDQ